MASSLTCALLSPCRRPLRSHYGTDAWSIHKGQFAPQRLACRCGLFAHALPHRTEPPHSPHLHSLHPSLSLRAGSCGYGYLDYRFATGER